MVFGFKKKETTEVKIARAAGKVAGRAVRTGKKAAATASTAARATRRAAGKVADRVTRTRNAAKRAVARRRLRKTLQTTGGVLKTVGKAATVAGLTAAAAATVSEIARRRR
jgi:hypothetical protein